MADVSYYSKINVQDFAFNSINGDKRYNADDLCEWLSTTNSNGVVSTPSNSLLVEAGVGLNVILKPGKGLIQGHSMKVINDIIISIETNSNFPSTVSRVDIVGFRLNSTSRQVEPFYRSGTAGVLPTAPTLASNELCLAEITVDSTGITNIKDTRDSSKCGFVTSTATIYKIYNQSFTTSSSITSFEIELSTFNPKIDLVEITVNGLSLPSDMYSITNNTVNLKEAIQINNDVHIKITHFYDASGALGGALKETETTTENMDKLIKYYYFGSGTDDNRKLSDMAQNFLAGTGEFTGVNANAQMEIIVCGDLTVTRNFSGDGSSTRPYTYFAFGRASSSTRTIYFNFSNCSQINISCYTTAGTYNTIFSGSDINIRNCRLNVTNGSNVNIFNGTNIHCVDSEFWMTTTNDCCVGRCCGTFENVRTSIASIAGNAFCFYGNGNLTRVIGGTHYAWTAGTDKESACFYVEALSTENVLFISMVNCPQYDRSGYTQTNTIKVNSGYATIMQSALWKASLLYSLDNCIAYGNVIISKP